MEKTEFIFVLGHSDAPVRNRDIIPTGDVDINIILGRSQVLLFTILSEALSARKTILRLARALQAMQRMSEAMRLLHHERRNYPECQEMQRLAESTRLALRF